MVLARRHGVRLILALLALLAVTPAYGQRARVRSRSLTRLVTVHARRNGFRVDHAWEVTGASRAELMRARARLTLHGPTGLFGGSSLLRTETPLEDQNIGGQIDARNVRPFLLWSRLGSRARTRLTLDGFEASMSEGTIGAGTSRVVIGETTLRAGVPVTSIVETGEYTLQLETPALLSPLSWGWSLMAATPPGQLALYPALYGMGTLHNEVFDAGSALAGGVNEERSGR